MISVEHNNPEAVPKRPAGGGRAQQGFGGWGLPLLDQGRGRGTFEVASSKTAPRIGSTLAGEGARWGLAFW